MRDGGERKIWGIIIKEFLKAFWYDRDGYGRGVEVNVKEDYRVGCRIVFIGGWLKI